MYKYGYGQNRHKPVVILKHFKAALAESSRFQTSLTKSQDKVIKEVEICYRMIITCIINHPDLHFDISCQKCCFLKSLPPLICTGNERPGGGRTGQSHEVFAEATYHYKAPCS